MAVGVIIIFKWLEMITGDRARTEQIRGRERQKNWHSIIQGEDGTRQGERIARQIKYLFHLRL
jgi:hypothetical protein